MKKFTVQRKGFPACSGGIWAILMGSCLPGHTPSRFDKLDDWMLANTKVMGGRIILVIYQDENIIYNKSVNEMNRRQKTVNHIIVEKLGQETDLDDYTLNSRQMIGSCSKWLSTALVMTFIDDGSLPLTDTVVTYLPMLTQYGRGNHGKDQREVI